MRVGLGLWTMRSTAVFPAAQPALHAELISDAREIERLGFDSLWLAEHHFWYDGWTPAPLVAAGAVLGATGSLRVGTAIHLAPLHDADAVVREVRWLDELSGGRFEHGIGLGYRAAEYDGFGLSRRSRGRRMDAVLDALAEAESPAPIWIGGMAEPALERAGRRGLGVLLPSTLRHDQIAGAIETVRENAQRAGRRPGPIGIMKYAWVTDGTVDDLERAVAITHIFTREYMGAWFPLRGRPGFESPDLLDKQGQRTVATGLFGTAEEVAAELAELAALGVELTILHLCGDGRRPERHKAIARIADHVLPAIEAAS